MSWESAGKDRWRSEDAYLLRTARGLAEAHLHADGHATVHLYAPGADVTHPGKRAEWQWMLRHFGGQVPEVGSPLDGHLCMSSHEVDELHGDDEDTVWRALRALADTLKG